MTNNLSDKLNYLFYREENDEYNSFQNNEIISRSEQSLQTKESKNLIYEEGDYQFDRKKIVVKKFYSSTLLIVFSNTFFISVIEDKLIRNYLIYLYIVLAIMTVIFYEVIEGNHWRKRINICYIQFV